MAQYKVVLGHHVDVDGKIHPKGSIIESDKKLDKIFHGKFKRVGSDGEEVEAKKKPAPTALKKKPASEDTAEEDDGQDDDDDEDEDEETEKKPSSARSTVVSPKPTVHTHIPGGKPTIKHK